MTAFNRVSRNGRQFVYGQGLRRQFAEFDKMTIQVLCRWRYNHKGFLYWDNVLSLKDGHCLTGHVTGQDKGCENLQRYPLIRDTWFLVEFEICLYSDFLGETSRLKDDAPDNYGVCNTRIVRRLTREETALWKFENGRERALRDIGERMDHAGDPVVSANFQKPTLKKKTDNSDK